MSDTKETPKSLYDDHLPYAISDKILYEFNLHLDQFKQINRRTSVQFLDYLGDLGGFQQIFFTLLGFIASIFSRAFVVPTVASELYIEKKRKSVIKKERRKNKNLKALDQIQGLFDKIRFSTWEQVFYPVFSYCCKSCC